MKLTVEKLKRMIKEEAQDLGEGHEAWSGHTHRAAQGFDQQAIQQLALEFEVFILNSPTVKNIQPPREGSIVQACQMAVDAIEAGESVVTHSTK